VPLFSAPGLPKASIETPILIRASPPGRDFQLFGEELII